MHELYLRKSNLVCALDKYICNKMSFDSFEQVMNFTELTFIKHKLVLTKFILFFKPETLILS